MIKDLLEKRAALKAKKPVFKRRDSHKKAKLKPSWRRPRGITNKLRLGKRGYGRKVETGWGSPAAVKGLARQGLEPVLVSNPEQLEGLNPARQGVVISGKVGKRKKALIVEKAGSLKLKILNLDPAKFLEELRNELTERNALKKAREQAAKKKESEKESKGVEEKLGKEEKPVKKELTPEERRKKEKEERDKILTKKQ